MHKIAKKKFSRPLQIGSNFIPWAGLYETEWVDCPGCIQNRALTKAHFAIEEVQCIFIKFIPKMIARESKMSYMVLAVCQYPSDSIHNTRLSFRVLSGLFCAYFIYL